MLIVENTELGSKTVLRNSLGEELLKVKSFDTETKEAEMYTVLTHTNPFVVRVAALGPSIQHENREVVTFKCHLLGYKAYNKETGEEIK